MDFTCKLIIKKNIDIGITAVKNAGHIGRLSDYCDQLAKKKDVNKSDAILIARFFVETRLIDSK